jgi:hypothetical protein
VKIRQRNSENIGAKNMAKITSIIAKMAASAASAYGGMALGSWQRHLAMKMAAAKMSYGGVSEAA